jgi:hypothetical protein
MDEVFPILGGVIVGLVVPALVPSRLRWVVAVVLSVVLGVSASWISGVLAVSTVYILIVVAQVLGATLATWVLVTAWRRRSARPA